MSTDAIVLLKDDHKQIKRLFREFEQAGECATKTKGSSPGVGAEAGGPRETAHEVS